MNSTEFVHLHVHTQYSILESACRIDKLVDLAHEHGMSALAITDHGNMFGAVEFYQACKKRGIKPIIGCEVFVAPGSRFDRPIVGDTDEADHHLVLLCKDKTGYRNLMKLVSAGYLEGYFNEPRIDRELLARHATGLVGLSGGLEGEIARLILMGRYDEAREAARWYAGIFDPGDFYLEIQKNGIPGQDGVSREIVRLGEELGLPLVATNNCRYLRREDACAHDILLCIKAEKTEKDADRPRMPGDGYHFKSPDEMHDAFSEHPEAIRSTVEIAGKCNLEMEFGTYHVPYFSVPEGYDTDSFFDEAARNGLEERFARLGLPEEAQGRYRRRLAEEMETIRQLGCQDYFLVVADYINYAKSRGIPVGPGRGSAVGSLVAYALGITDVDPIRWNLLFERFLNPESRRMPDIDVDFCEERREEVLSYVKQKYGEDRVSQVITFGAMKARGAIREVGRVMGIPGAECDKIVKLMLDTPGIALEEAIEQEPELSALQESEPRIKEMLTVAKSLEGLIRHTSTHVAGLVTSPGPLTDHVPLCRNTKTGEIATQYNLWCLEKIGLIKFDFLGLSALTIIDKVVRMVNRGRGGSRTAPTLNIALIPLDDRPTFELLSNGRTDGVFQLESTGIKDLLVKLKPSCFEDIIALMAIYRPGPFYSEMVDDFVARKHAATPIAYEPPQLEPILKDTYGLILYDEQVMRIAQALTGYPPGESDLFRQALRSREPEEIERESEKFVAGAVVKGIEQKEARRVFNLMSHYVRFSFNKSHAAAYALIAYRMAWLKANYPEEFVACLVA